MKINQKILPIAITGPESTGKSTLVQLLAKYFKSRHTTEYARHYIHEINRAYTPQDVLHIAKKQYESNEALIKKVQQTSLVNRNNQPIVMPVFFDTELLVTKIWYEHAYGKNTCPQWIQTHLKQQNIKLYLLPNPDVEWIADPQREHPDPSLRQYLFDRYEKELQQLSANYIVISGNNYHNRLQQAISAVAALMQNTP